jgi:hypothetical protein
VFKRRVVASLVIAVGIAGAWGGIGCGSDDDSGLTKAEFNKQATAICARIQKEQAAHFAEYYKAAQKKDPNRTELELEEASLEPVILPSFQKKRDELKALEPPAEDKAKVEAILRHLSEGVAAMEAQGGDGKFPEPLEAFVKAADEYGFTCEP